MALGFCFYVCVYYCVVNVAGRRILRDGAGHGGVWAGSQDSALVVSALCISEQVE